MVHKKWAISYCFFIELSILYFTTRSKGLFNIFVYYSSQNKQRKIIVPTHNYASHSCTSPLSTALPETTRAPRIIGTHSSIQWEAVTFIYLSAM